MSLFRFGRSAHPLTRLLAAGFLAISLSSALPAMSVRVPTFPELVSGSGQIVRGRVVKVEPVDRIAPDGRPFVKTQVTWEIESTVKGSAGQTLTLEFLGGKTAARHLRIPGMPKFTVGDTEYLFVEPNTAIVCPVFAGGYGRYFVAQDEVTGRRYVTRDNRVPLTDSTQVAEPLNNALPAVLAARPASEALSVEQFETAIRAEIARQNGGQHAE